ncbi:hypothetical protein Ae201684P_013218 [Aphanomyces euteiches]|uniref:Vacuolar membrane protease n=2 Tax=Aphanomyces euteiches TaxID=100861 RepID=A0A6G0WRY4_9STRA|nr:hypothetical protein Ae201684_012193 [Aphanomyces euteiches]KAH9096550.1 hypothetical protein Ae201684P_013218 [Aphanomyces euteiches]KAH9155109.1 hypothetical protein AeRB84_002889 [Aphanomyces euteiches]
MGRFLLWLSFFVAACAVATINFFWRMRMPDVNPLSEAADVFSGTAAYDTLRNITTTKHPIETQENLNVYHYLYDRLEELNRTSATDDLGPWLVLETPRTTLRTYTAPVQSNTTTQNRSAILGSGCSRHAAYINTTQIIARVPGLLPSSVLLTAHFDSVKTSYGASDDGAGVAVLLEVLRAVLAQKTRPKHTLIAFIDNGEEYGLCGSSWFLRNKLDDQFKVKVFVNLEGGGVGGRAILFRATDDALASLYGSVAPHPHMNSVGGSLISVLGSYTDFSNYQPANIAGLDIAFYESRQFYHTPQDNIDHITPADVQHCGDNVLAITSTLLNTDSLDDWSANDQALFFDFVGQWGFDLAPLTRWLGLVVVWVLTAAVVSAHFYCFPVKAPTINVFFWSLLDQWGYYWSSLLLGIGIALLANVPLVLFLFVTNKPYISWTVLPSSFFGHLFGVALAANRWRHRQGIRTLLPATINWMHLATAATTFGSFLSILTVFNLPMVVLIAISTASYSVVLLIAMGVSYAYESYQGQKPGRLWQSHVSYSAIPTITAGYDDAPPASQTLLIALVIALLGFLFLPFQFSVDWVWMIQSVGGYDPIIMAFVPIFLSPVMFFLLPWFATWDPQDGLYRILAQLYLLVWVGATVQYAAI